MALQLPFLNSGSRKKRTQLISIDLGARTTKAVLLEKRGDAVAMTNFILLDAPIFDKKISPELLGDHLHSVAQALGSGTKFLAATVGLDDVMVRPVELPMIGADEARLILKANHKNYFQQDLPNHVFDCFYCPPRPEDVAPKAAEPARNARAKAIGAACRQQFVTDFLQATKAAGLTADLLIPALIAPINAFELAFPEVFTKETVALVDVGFKHTSVCVLDRGQLVLNRTMNIGGDKLTNGIAEAMNISYAEADGIKVGMAPEVQSALEANVMMLGRELRASLDFFEHQHDRAVSQIFVCGGTADSEVIMQMLQVELLAECKKWNALSCLQIAVPAQKTADLEHFAPQLSGAIGAGVTAF